MILDYFEKIRMKRKNNIKKEPHGGCGSKQNSEWGGNYAE